jgi:RNA polymerase sigma factor (sigma-70 family)
MTNDDGFSITALVGAAVEGDQAAWSEIVERYSPLLVGVLRQCGLTAAETEDVAQTVWLRLVEHLDGLREPRALPMWIITTGRREAWRQIAVGRRVQLRDPASEGWIRLAVIEDPTDEDLIREERKQALFAGLAELGARDRALLLMLMEDPPPSYVEVSRRTGIPIGGIGPTRSRALARLRRTVPVQTIVAGEADRPDHLSRAKG